MTTVKGGEWKPQTLRTILIVPRISGQRDHHGEIVAQAEWPGIITPAQTHADPCEADRPGRRTNRTPAAICSYGS